MNTLLMLQLLWDLTRLRWRDRWTRQQLEAHQAEALRRLRVYAYARSPFYQRFHQGLADRPLHELPVLTKATLMEHFDELVTDRQVRLEAVRAHLANAGAEKLFLGRYWVSSTSGSTGRPGLFLFDRSEWLAILTSFARAHDWAGLQVSLTHRMKMAAVASTNPWHMSAQVAATLRSWWMPALRLEAAEPLERLVQQLNTFQPEMLVAYASMARLLAEEQRAGRLRIAPHLVFTSSEVLTAETRRLAEEAWGHQPFNQYGATEGGGLAAECERHTGMHVMEDLALLEVVDERNRLVPPGEYGDKVLLTLFSSRTQPLIRYEVSDSLRLAEGSCPCGRPFVLIDDVQGRMEEVLRFPTATGGEVAVHPNTFHHVMDTVPSSGWQVVQEPDGLTVLLSGVREDLEDSALVERLRRDLAAQDALVPEVRVQRVAAIPRAASGKAPLIKSNLPPRGAGAGRGEGVVPGADRRLT
ncbi:MAG: phenylacetate--CoA ligase family protein [Chloroflexi bacterium]|nr:phenylacetate--CoA ligase family protein [Chloroflexota bacterium]